MAEMVDRVREAIAEAIRRGKDPAKAAVKAMRDATPEMIAAALDDEKKKGRKGVYPAMIDAALK